MPKLPHQGITRKIGLDQIVVTDNVRKVYENIEELAATIKKNGLLQPIVVRPYGESNDGVPLYELIFGHRRRLAFLMLCEKGDDFSQIDAIIKTGNKRTLQLVENLQRNNLNHRETEKAITEMAEDGKTQTEISEELGRPLSWISDILAAAKVRSRAEQAGFDVNSISSKALCQLRSVEDSNFNEAIKITINKGGTVAAATGVLNLFRLRKKTNNSDARAVSTEKRKGYTKAKAIKIVQSYSEEMADKCISLLQEPQKNDQEIKKINNYRVSASHILRLLEEKL